MSKSINYFHTDSEDSYLTINRTSKEHLAKRGSTYTQAILIDEVTSVHEKLSYRQKIRSFRAKVYNFLEKPRGTISFLYHLVIFFYIVFVHSLSALSTEKWAIEIIPYLEASLAVYFTTEFVVRIWSIGADAKYSGFHGFLKYTIRLGAFIDIVIISVTFFILLAHKESYFDPDTLEKIQFLQILRLLHIDRQMTTWTMIKKMIVRSFRELVTIYWISGLVFLLIVCSVYEIETSTESKRREMNETVESTFNNYGEAFWFGIITVLTVGYGDIVPKHWISKLTVGVLCFFGVSMFSAASSLVGVGMSLMVENETKMQHATKVRNMAARLIQSWYRFHLISDVEKFADFHQFRKFCSDLHHVEERIKTARMLAKKAAIKENDASTVSENSLGSFEFSDEEKLLEYYYDPYKGETASISKRSVDTTTSVSALDDETINRYRQILRLLHYFIFQTTKKKFNRARKPYELLDAENELCEMEYQRMQKVKELELRVQATVGKPTISPFEEDQSQKLNIEDRLILCEEMLRKLEIKAKIIDNLGTLIMDTFQTSPRPRPDPRKGIISLGEEQPGDKFLSKVRDEQKRRVLFKEHSFG
ncbi:hypothetical protein FO519_001225 [Halicephalobus sp. NKZ332]|nr:hypothetical protein FO519_001225 [Halicephalobus sp. NKZ332]